MKATRLVLGLLGIILAAIMFITGIIRVFEVSVYNGFVPSDLNEAANYGALVAPIFLIGAIMMIICCRRGILGGCITSTILFAICGIIGISGLNSMNFAMGWLIVIAVYLVIALAGLILNATLRL